LCRLATRYVERDIQLLIRVRTFAKTIEAPTTLRSLARQIEALADNRIRAFAPPEASQTKVKQSSPNYVDELAVALTIVEGEHFASVLPGQIVAYLVRQPAPAADNDRSALDDALETHALVRRWVKRSVLRCDDLESRVLRIEFMIAAAQVSVFLSLPSGDHAHHRSQECRRIRNFSSANAIVKALRSSQLKRLMVTYKKLPEACKKTLTELEVLTAEAGDFKAYRETLASSSSACVPVLGERYCHLILSCLERDAAEVHLSGFSRLFSDPPITSVENGQTIVDFTRCTKLAREITGFLARHKALTIAETDAKHKPEQLA
jgi:hypothetical protein